MTSVVPAPAAPGAPADPSSSPSLALVDLALQAAEAYGRPDLAARLQRTRRRVADPDIRVLVVGEFKQGKSALVNALVGAEVCPVDDDLATSVTTVVRYGAGPSSVTVVRETPTPDSAQALEHRTEVDLADIARYVSEAGNPGNREGVSYVEVRLQRRVLSSGLVLVDTPGVGGLGSAHGAMTMGALATADAVLLVSDAAGEYTAPELRFLGHAASLCPVVAGVVTKTDLHPRWREIVERDRAHLSRARIAADLLPTSSRLRAEAQRRNDPSLNDEAGFTALLDYLRERVVAQSAVLDRRLAAHDVGSAAELMARPMRGELEALRDPDHARRLVATLTTAQQRAEELKTRSARWQTTLNDGFADLQSDVDHDLRDRLRALGRDAEAHFDEGDPADVWDEVAAELQSKVAEEAATNFLWAGRRARHLAHEVAEHFALEGHSVLPDVERLRRGPSSRLEPIPRPDLERHRLGQKLFTGMRGGYGGMLMVGMATSLAGLGLFNPFSVAAGVIFGAQGLREERKALLTRRKGEARTAVRRHIDDVTFVIGKDSRDMLRMVQRTLRDHYQSLATELARSTGEAVAAAQQAVTTATTDRSRRQSDLEAEIARLDAVSAQARELVAVDARR